MRKKIVTATIAFLMLGSIAAYAYVAATATATITVSEALYIDTAGISIGGGALKACVISADKASASCSLDAYPGESGSVGITIANRGTAALNTTETAASSSAELTVTVATPTASVPGGGSKFFLTDFSISPSAAPATFTINFTFSR